MSNTPSEYLRCVISKHCQSGTGLSCMTSSNFTFISKVRNIYYRNVRINVRSNLHLTVTVHQSCGHGVNVNVFVIFLW